MTVAFVLRAAPFAERMMKYDDATWHSGGEFPPESPAEFGGTHIALFLRWCFVRGWAGEHHPEEAIRQVVSGAPSATKFLFEWCDGQLTNEDLTEAGNAFASQVEDFGDLMYVAPEEKHDFGRFSAMVEARFRAASSPTRKPGASGRGGDARSGDRKLTASGPS